MDRVDELTEEVFNTVIALRHLSGGSGENPERLQRQVKKEIDKMMRVGPTIGVAHSDTQEMAYAIVALLDELALKAPPAISDYWTDSLLQRDYFDENIAGEGFFVRLDDHRKEQRWDVLRVYYICLLLGFRGRYAMRGGDLELQDLTTSLREELARQGPGDDEPLAPNGERPIEPLTRKAKTMRLLWIPVGAVGGAVALYAVLALLVRTKAGSLIETIATLIK